jgi:hypothetical protein
MARNFQPFSLIIAGPISSRYRKDASENLNEEALRKCFLIIKNIDQRNELIISTYEGEVASYVNEFTDQVIYNLDPGADQVKDSTWPLGDKTRRSQRNYSRLFYSSLNAIVAAKNNVVIKTRIELIPVNEKLFRNWYLEIEHVLTDGKIAFFTEAYSGVQFAIDGVIPKMPDILLVSTKKTAVSLWGSSYNFWNANKEFFSRKGIILPIGSEQILGLIYLHIYYNFDIYKYLHKLRLHHVSYELMTKLIQAENESFIWARYYNSGFSQNYFKGMYFIRVPENIISKSKKYLYIKILIMFLKKIKHLVRRYLRGLKTEFIAWTKS